jgi:hypothetical protein
MSMCLDVTDFMKDNVNASKDLSALYDHPLLEAKPNARGESEEIKISILFEVDRKERGT